MTSNFIASVEVRDYISCDKSLAASLTYLVETMAPSSALPIGSAPVITETKPVLIDPSIPGSGLLNTVLAVLTPMPALSKNDPVTGLPVTETEGVMPESSDEAILSRDVAGFIVMYVIDVRFRNLVKSKITYYITIYAMHL
jgi:hypothetical protein